jgi:cytochrome b561
MHLTSMGPSCMVGLPGVLSRSMYLVLYILLMAEAVSGFVLRWLQGESFAFLGPLSIPALIAPDRSSAHQLEEFHNWIGWAIVVLAMGHAIAALVHHRDSARKLPAYLTTNTRTLGVGEAASCSSRSSRR